MRLFTPRSPDPFIRTEGDQALAKFGHLNAILRYLRDLPLYSSNSDALTAGLEPGEWFILSSTKAVTQVQ